MQEYPHNLPAPTTAGEAAELVLNVFAYPGGVSARIRTESAEALNAAAALLAPAAESGDAVAQYALAVCYSEGFGLPEDSLEQVYHWSRKAFDGGVKAAGALLGTADETEEAERFDCATAALGEDPVKAHTMLAFLHLTSDTGDPARARAHLQAVIDMGAAHAIVPLLDFYCADDEGEVDPDLYLGCLETAAEQYSADAMVALADCYSTGYYVEADDELAEHWYAAAAEQYGIEAALGKPGSMYGLGRLLLDGNGVEADREAALDYFRRAADAGCEDAREALENL